MGAKVSAETKHAMEYYLAYRSHGCTKAEAAKHYGIAWSTLHRALKREPKPKGKGK